MNGQDPHDVPGFDRATMIDDPTPRAEYRDEPPREKPRRHVRTTYTVKPLYGEPGTGFTTDDPNKAQEYSQNGHRVTAESQVVIE